MLSTTAKRTVRPVAVLRGYILAALALMLLCLLPQTGWIARRQLTGQGNGGRYYESGSAAEAAELQKQQQAKRAFAAKHPDNLAVQIAWALDAEPLPVPKAKITNLSYAEEQQVKARAERAHRRRLLERVWSLRKRFHGAPAFYAAYLRFACAEKGDLRLDLGRRADMYNARTWQGYQKRPHRAQVSTDAELARRFMKAAKQGERFDPANGFFPTTQAVILFTREQDDSALEALGLASAKPVWNDYLQTEIAGHNLLNEAVEGPQSATQRLTYKRHWDGEYLDAVRTMGNIAITQAFLRERSRDTRTGLQIRRAIAHVGMHLRVEAPYHDANRQGINLVRDAGYLPGGVNLDGDSSGSGVSFSGMLSDDLAALARLETRRQNIATARWYINYLNRLGEHREAHWYAGESAAALRTEAVLQTEAVSGPVYNQSDNPGEHSLKIIWQTGSVLLTQTLFVLLLSGVGAWVARSPRMREALPLESAGRWGLAMFPVVWIGGYLGTMPVCSYLRLWSYGETGQFVIAVILGAAIALVPFAWLHRPPRGQEWNRGRCKIHRRRAMRQYAQTILLTNTLFFILLMLNALLAHRETASVSCVSLFSTMPLDETCFECSPITSTISILVSSLVPLLAVCTMIVSRKRRIPISVGLAFYARAAGPRIAAGLFALWMGAVIVTASQKHSVRQEQSVALQHEGRYHAALSGVAWPDATPETVGNEEL